MEPKHSLSLLKEMGHYVITVLGRIADHWVLKLIGGAAFLFFEFLFGGIANEVLVAILALVIFDFMTAVYAAFICQDPVKSRKIFRTAIKLVVYFLLIAAGHIAETTVPLKIIDDTIIAFLAITELISIIENVSKAGYAVPMKLLEKLREFTNKQ